MSRGYSDATFLGNVVRDPVCKTTVNGRLYCRFSIAVENGYKQGEKYIKTTDFFNLVAWEKMALYCEKSIKQGTRVFVNAVPKNYKPQNAKYSIVFFTISFLNIENNRKNIGGKASATEPKGTMVFAPEERQQNQVLRELPEDVEAIQEEINEYYYFDEEDYSEL